MSNYVSINIAEIDPTGAIFHNERVELPYYIFKDEKRPVSKYRHILEPLNKNKNIFNKLRNQLEQNRLLNDDNEKKQSRKNILACENNKLAKFFINRQNEIEVDYKNRYKRALQKSTKLYQEAIIIFSEEQFLKCSEEDIENSITSFCDAFEEKYGCKILYTSLHLDEGHTEDIEKIENGEIKITPQKIYNTHAHFLIENYNFETHKTCLQRLDYRKLQTEIANHFAPLGFIRGESQYAMTVEGEFSKDKIKHTARLDHKQYRRVMEQIKPEVTQLKNTFELLIEPLLNYFKVDDEQTLKLSIENLINLDQENRAISNEVKQFITEPDFIGTIKKLVGQKNSQAIKIETFDKDKLTVKLKEFEKTIITNFTKQLKAKATKHLLSSKSSIKLEDIDATNEQLIQLANKVTDEIINEQKIITTQTVALIESEPENNLYLDVKKLMIEYNALLVASNQDKKFKGSDYSELAKNKFNLSFLEERKDKLSHLCESLSEQIGLALTQFESLQLHNHQLTAQNSTLVAQNDELRQTNTLITTTQHNLNQEIERLNKYEPKTELGLQYAKYSFDQVITSLVENNNSLTTEQNKNMILMQEKDKQKLELTRLSKYEPRTTLGQTYGQYYTYDNLAQNYNTNSEALKIAKTTIQSLSDQVSTIQNILIKQEAIIVEGDKTIKELEIVNAELKNRKPELPKINEENIIEVLSRSNEFIAEQTNIFSLNNELLTNLLKATTTITDQHVKLVSLHNDLEETKRIEKVSSIVQSGFSR